MLQRQAPIRPNLHSKTIKNSTTLRPLSSDAIDLSLENARLREEYKALRENYQNLQREYDRLKNRSEIRKNVRKGILDRRYLDEREDYVKDMRDKYGMDLDMGTFSEQMLVGYNDPEIQMSPRERKLSGGSFKKKKPKKTPKKVNALKKKKPKKTPKKVKTLKKKA